MQSREMNLAGIVSMQLYAIHGAQRMGFQTA